MAALARMIAFVAALLLAGPAMAQADGGRRIEYREIAAAGLPPQRLTIWLPPGYDGSDRRYPVLYMHDGHNLFDLASSNFAKIWAADRAMLAHIRKGGEPWIIVGIWAPGEDRYRQYLPRPAYDAAPPALRARMDAMARGPVVSDAYLAWIAGVLKPWMDGAFRTRPGRDDTAIAGSSMGGLMACYALIARPEVFGRAACVSSHWPAVAPDPEKPFDAQTDAVWTGWLRARLGPPQGRRVWMDHGDGTLDAFYAPYQRSIDAAFREAGWAEGRDFASRSYPGAVHDENAWAVRLPEILDWLLAR